MLNNFEVGILIACALASTLSLGWLAIIFTSHCLRSIDIAHHLRTIAESAVEIAHPIELVERATVQHFAAGADLKVGDAVVIRDGVAYPAKPGQPQVVQTDGPSTTSFTVMPETCDHRRAARILRAEQQGAETLCRTCGARVRKVSSATDGAGGWTTELELVRDGNG